jgi:hypothetical protein
MKCPRCDIEAFETARFCGSCGTLLSAKCPACGKVTTLGQRFCTQCGAEMTATSAGMSEKQRIYLEKKHRDLSAWENAKIREHIQAGSTDVYDLADEFGCVPVQIAGIKSAITKGH